MEHNGVRILSLSDSALCIELGQGIDRETNARVHALCRAINAAGIAGVAETVPTYRSLAVHYDMLKTGQDELISALLPIDSISVSRIPHPNARFSTGQNIRAIVKSCDELGRITLSHRELLGTWEENSAAFKAGETVPGIVRSVEKYGIFVELTPNLAGLAEYCDGVKDGDHASVYIKSILPQRMKIKLVIVDSFSADYPPAPIRYFTDSRHIDSWVYSPEGCEKVIESVFCEEDQI